MTNIPASHHPGADRSHRASAGDPLLLELGLIEVQQDNARLRQIIAELLVKNQALRWALQGENAAFPVDLTLFFGEAA